MSRLSLLAVAGLVAFATAPAAHSQSCLSTLFAANNGGSVGGAVYFDVTVSNAVIIQGFETNFDNAVGTAIGLDFYMTAAGSSYVGNEANPAAWTLVESGVGVSSGLNVPSVVPLNNAVTVTPGTYGFALVAIGDGHRYTSSPNPSFFSDSFLSITLGAASNVPFTGTPFSPRGWNGSICYLPANGIFAGFSADVTSGPVGQNVNFTDSSFSSDPGGILSWAWDVDGNGSVDYTTQNCSHVYGAEGLYTVSLTVTDNLNGNSTETKTGYIAIDVVDAAFTWAPGAGNNISFTDASTGNPTSWMWDFDNNGSIDSTLQNPSFTYPGPGTYSCTLMVADAVSNDTTTQTVSVSVLDVGPFVSTFSSATLTRGFYFQAPVKFSFTSLQVPDESGHGLQNVAVYNFGQTPPPAFSATIAGVPIFFAAGVPSNTSIPCALSFEAGDWVGVIGACGDATTMRSSYGNAQVASSLFGNPVTLFRCGTQTNIVSNSGVCPIWSENAGSIGRVLCGVSPATGVSYGVGSPSTLGGVAPVLSTTGLPIIGSTGILSVELDAADDPAQMFLLAGLGRQNIPLGNLTLNVIPLIPAIGPIAGATGPNAIPLQVPLGPYAGIQIDFQNINLSGAGVSASNGEEWCLNF